MMAYLGDIGRSQPFPWVPTDLRTTFQGAGVELVEIPGAPVRQIVFLTIYSITVDRRRTDDDGVCRFPNLEQGVYYANTQYMGLAWAWRVEVSVGSYTVTPVISALSGEPSYVSIG